MSANRLPPAPPVLPPCQCGMPSDLTGTRAHRRWHRAWASRRPLIDTEARARAWITDHTTTPTSAPRGGAGDSGAEAQQS